ncbi:hypothetical protein ACVNF4_29010 [Streptomyces sp. S6]
MTENADRTTLTEQAVRPAGPSTGRLIGVDLARGLAVFGMYARQAVAKVVIRAVVLLALGTLLTASGTPVQVILAIYGLYFLLVLPLYRLHARSLAVVAGASALVLPQVLYVVQSLLADRELGGVWTWPGETGGVAGLLFFGSYPGRSRPN